MHSIVPPQYSTVYVFFESVSIGETEVDVIESKVKHFPTFSYDALFLQTSIVVSCELHFHLGS